MQDNRIKIWINIEETKIILRFKENISKILRIKIAQFFAFNDFKDSLQVISKFIL